MIGSSEAAAQREDLSSGDVTSRLHAMRERFATNHRAA
jgi:hypothetical protein